MKLSIIPEDSAVVVDGVPLDELDLSPASVPGDVHALQWDNNSGWIEYKDASSDNQDITNLPSWANTCETIYQTALTAYNDSLGNNYTPEENVRIRRGRELEDTDWWASTDLTMTSEQIAYRQALRDITDQAGFPDNVTWPTKPA